MFALRRAAARAIAAPSKTLFSQKPRSITTFTPIAFRSRQQQWSVPAFQRRFVSDEAVKKEEDVAIEEKVAEDKAVEAASREAPAPEEFLQTATEAPVDEDVTPVQEATPIEAESNLTGDAALGAAAGAAVGGGQRSNFAVAPAPPSQELYIGNLFFQVTEDQLRRVFSRFGPVEHVKLIKDPSGRPRGFGYIKFENQADATAAMENLDMQVFEGRNMVVQYTRGKKQVLTRTGGFERTSSPPSKTLYIGNMSFEMTDKDLNDLFKNVRNVLDVRVAIDRRTGQPRGFAHADFLDIASAEKAKAQLAEQVLYGRKLRIDFGRSSKGENEQN